MFYFLVTLFTQGSQNFNLTQVTKVAKSIALTIFTRTPPQSSRSPLSLEPTSSSLPGFAFSLSTHSPRFASDAYRWWLRVGSSLCDHDSVLGSKSGDVVLDDGVDFNCASIVCLDERKAWMRSTRCRSC
ncbi:hypothetical protein Pyn_15464 [Prunus yedoensis var. nudiflora]|uniref:Uncharacterized protein n=1 Tax=Prunus yedoensis var. nudiflora TaxID=2094558 RepID=A0A314XR54_PRUYE|nr:hypothetical protein Pyn_15464 [Prunus yedoensis var. nudiflora]